MIFIYFIYIIFGILPSLAWLFYYLKKDQHPESKKMILKIFLLGALSTIPVYFVQKQLIELLYLINLPSIFIYLIYWFLIIAFTEELFKYLVVKFKVLKNPEFDEPIDAMIYMTVSALGFAAVENVFYVISSAINLPTVNDAIFTAAAISFIRFLGSTFLHTLCSALVGYFIAISFTKPQNRLRYTILGILLATLLHGLYNFSIMTIESNWLKITIPIILLLTMALLIISKFDKIKKLKSICKIK